MHCRYTRGLFVCLLFALSASTCLVAMAGPPPPESLYKSWYFTPTGVFGRGPIDKPTARSFVRITHPAGDLAVIESVNAAGVTTHTTRIQFTDGLISLATVTDRWGNSYDSTWYKPDGPGKFLVTRRVNGINPFLPARFCQYSFTRDLLTDILCFTDSVHAGPDRQGVAHYVYERYDDDDRRALIKTETYFTNIDMPALAFSSGVHKVANEYDKKADLRTRSAYNEQDKPTLDNDSVFQTKYKYDGDDNPIQIDYYDVHGELTITTRHYSEVQLEYKRGMLTEESYFFDVLHPAMTSSAADSISMIGHQYDKDGNEIKTDYFDKEDFPVNNSHGYQEVTNLYNTAGMLIRSAFIPLLKDSRLLSKTYTVTSYTRDDKGRITSQERLTSTGVRLPDANIVNLTKYRYDASGRVCSESYWQNDTTAMRCSLGYHEIVVRYDENGQIWERDFNDLNGEPASAVIGYSRELITYNEMAMPASRAWFAGDQPVLLDDPAAQILHYHRIQYNYDLAYRLRSVDFVDEQGHPVSAILHPTKTKTLTAQHVELQFAGGSLAREILKDTGAANTTLDCAAGQCLPLVAFEQHSSRERFAVTHPLRAYHGATRPDTLFGNMLGFIGTDSVLVFLTKDGSHQIDIGCSDLYRVAPVNKYYQLDGRVVDRYMANDSVAASLNYDRGKLEGHAWLFYPNGVVREHGMYRNNLREGVWEYFYDNGRRERTLQYVAGQPALMAFYTKDGELLAHDGDGRFEGYIATANGSNSYEVFAKGNIKEGVPDGEWNLYQAQMTGPSNTEYFTLGKFQKGISYSLMGKSTYTAPFTSLETLHSYETLDHYRHDPMCTPVRAYYSNLYAEVRKGFAGILASNKYGGYSGWVFLDLKIDGTGRILNTYIKLYQPNAEFEKEVRAMAAKLAFPSIVRAGEQSDPYEKMYIILVEGSEVVIPEEVLEDQRRVIRP
jgi:hypothetical protein